MSIGAIVLIIIGGVIVYSIILGVRSQRKWSKEFNESLLREGFSLSPESKGIVERMVKTVFSQKANIINRIVDPYKVNFKNNKIYFCDVHLGGKGKYDLVFSDIFLFPFRPKTDQPFMLFMKAECSQGVGYVKDIISKQYVLSDLYKPDGLVILPLQERSELDAILFAYGRKGSYLDDLLDGAMLRLATQAGQYDFFALYYNQGMAGLLTLKRFKFHKIFKIDWTRQLRYVKKLMQI